MFYLKFWFLQVGDIVSVIDMPPKVLSTWWRGKHGFQVSKKNTKCGKTQRTFSVYSISVAAYKMCQEMALEMFKDVCDSGVSPDLSLVVLCCLSSPPVRCRPSIPFLNWLEPGCRQSQAWGLTTFQVIRALNMPCF